MYFCSALPCEKTHWECEQPWGEAGQTVWEKTLFFCFFALGNLHIALLAFLPFMKWQLILRLDEAEDGSWLGALPAVPATVISFCSAGLGAPSAHSASFMVSI